MTIQPRTLAGPRHPDAPEPARLCARCGVQMEERKCKIICANCGAYDDCSDP